MKLCKWVPSALLLFFSLVSCGQGPVQSSASAVGTWQERSLKIDLGWGGDSDLLNNALQLPVVFQSDGTPASIKTFEIPSLRLNGEASFQIQCVRDLQPQRWQLSQCHIEGTSTSTRTVAVSVTDTSIGAYFVWEEPARKLYEALQVEEMDSGIVMGKEKKLTGSLFQIVCRKSGEPARHQCEATFEKSTASKHQSSNG